MTIEDAVGLVALGFLSGAGAQVVPGPMLLRSIFAAFLPRFMATLICAFWTLQGAVGSAGIAVSSADLLALAWPPAIAVPVHLITGRLAPASSGVARLRPLWIGSLAGLAELVLIALARG